MILERPATLSQHGACATLTIGQRGEVVEVGATLAVLERDRLQSKRRISVQRALCLVFGIPLAVLGGMWALLGIAFINDPSVDMSLGSKIASWLITLAFPVVPAFFLLRSASKLRPSPNKPSARTDASSDDFKAVVYPAFDAQLAVPIGGSTTSDQTRAAKVGTRQNPHPLGTTVTDNKNWGMTVNSFTADATAQVLAANPFNSKPDPGHTYALVNVTITYIGANKGTTREISIAYVTSAGNVTNAYDKLGVVAPSNLGFQQLYNGASITRNEALHIPQGDAGTVRIRLGYSTDDVFFATK